MQLTKHTDYAFRVLIYLAGIQHSSTKRVTILDVSLKFNISKTHIMKIVNELANSGFIKSVRGKNGGISLGKDPKDINLKDILIQMEKTLDPINCNEPMCLIKGICGLKPILIGAQAEYLKYLGQYSLDNLINNTVIKKLNESSQQELS